MHCTSKNAVKSFPAEISDKYQSLNLLMNDKSEDFVRYKMIQHFTVTITYYVLRIKWHVLTLNIRHFLTKNGLLTFYTLLFGASSLITGH